MRRGIKAQAAVDFMMSYGIAMMIIFIALAVIYKVSVLTPVLATASCTPSAGFSCDLFILNKTGTLTLTFSQATGAAITIKGVACSSQINASGNKPAFGNIYVTNGFGFYPVGTYNSPRLGWSLYSDGSNTIYLYCYVNSGKATGILGNGFTGYIWLNYTVPGYGNITQQVALLNTKYT